MAKKKSLPIYALAFCLFLGGVGYMVWAGLSENTVYFLNVSEALDIPHQERPGSTLPASGRGKPFHHALGGLCGCGA